MNKRSRPSSFHSTEVTLTDVLEQLDSLTDELSDTSQKDVRLLSVVDYTTTISAMTKVHGLLLAPKLPAIFSTLVRLIESLSPLVELEHWPQAFESIWETLLLLSHVIPGSSHRLLETLFPGRVTNSSVTPQVFGSVELNVSDKAEDLKPPSLLLFPSCLSLPTPFLSPKSERFFQSVAFARLSLSQFCLLCRSLPKGVRRFWLEMVESHTQSLCKNIPVDLYWCSALKFVSFGLMAMAHEESSSIKATASALLDQLDHRRHLLPLSVQMDLIVFRHSFGFFSRVICEENIQNKETSERRTEKSETILFNKPMEKTEIETNSQSKPPDLNF